MMQRILRRLEYARLTSGVKPFHDFLGRWPDLERLRFQCADDLRPAYDAYTRDVSRADMAASLELGAFLCALCRSKKPHRLLDLGSGFSSFVFRAHARAHPGTQVISVDDDQAWLERTADFLRHNGLSDSHLMKLDDLLASKESAFDLILHDLNFVEVRLQYVETVLSALAPGGVAVFDDVHKRDYVLPLLKILEDKPGTCYSLKPVTLDRFNRFALAYVAP